MHSPSLPVVLEETAKGNLSLDFAATHVEKYLLSLENIEQGFWATTSGQPSEIAEQCRPQAQSVGRLLKLLQTAAEQAADSIEEGQVSVLPPVADRIRALTHDFNRYVAVYREASLVAIGPTGLAGINLIARTAQALLDQGPSDRLCGDLNSHIQQELDRIELARCQSIHANELAAPLNHLEAALQALLQACLPQPEDSAEAAIDRLLDHADAFESQLKEVERGQDLSQGDSPFGRINRLLNTAEKVWDGQAELSELTELCHSLQHSLGTWRSQLGAVARRLEPKPQVLELAQQLDDAYDHFDALLADFLQSVQEKDGENYDQCSQNLVPQWTDVVASQRALEDSLQNHPKVLCVHCGHSNRKDLRSCENCSAVLPPVAAQERNHGIDVHTNAAPAESAPQMTDNLRRLFTALDGFTNGTLALEDLQLEVDRLSGRLEQTRRSQTVGALFLDGLQDIEAGLGFLEQMTDSSQTDLAQTGAKLIWEGSGKIQRAN